MHMCEYIFVMFNQDNSHICYLTCHSPCVVRHLKSPLRDFHMHVVIKSVNKL